MIEKIMRDMKAGNIFDPSIAEIDGVGVIIEMDFAPTRPWLRIISTIYIAETKLMLYAQCSKAWKKENTQEMNISNALDEFAQCIDEMHFNKLTGKLIVGEPEPSLSSIYPLLKKNKKLKSRYEECCVCYDQTGSHPACGHHICIPCWERIPEKKLDEEDEEDEDAYSCQKCPVCRGDMSR